MFDARCAKSPDNIIGSKSELSGVMCKRLRSLVDCIDMIKSLSFEIQRGKKIYIVYHMYYISREKMVKFPDQEKNQGSSSDYLETPPLPPRNGVLATR